MKNPLLNRKNLLIEEEMYISKFDYTEIEKSDKEVLIEYEKKIKTNQINIMKSTLIVGEILKEAQNKLKNYVDGTFMKWYQSLGFNKDSVSYFLKRYSLVMEFPQKKDYIAEMPIRVIKELTKKNIKKELVKEAIEEEIIGNKELKALKIKYSHDANTKIIKTKVEKDEIIEILEKYINENESIEITEIFFERYKIKRK